MDPQEALVKKSQALGAKSNMLGAQMETNEVPVKTLTAVDGAIARVKEERDEAKKRGLQAGLKLDKMDSERISQETNAKVEVYNYAARFGLIPQYELQCMEENVAEGTPAYYEHKIDVQEQGIHVTGRHEVFKGAEVAACLKFKHAAEEYQRNQGPEHTTAEGTRVLSTHNVSEFFTMYRNIRRKASTELDMHKISLGSRKDQAYRVHVNIDGRPVAAPVVDLNEKRAEVLAYLAAAVALSKINPTLLPDFFKQLRAGAGKIARALAKVEMLVNAKAYKKIRDTLKKAENLTRFSTQQYQYDLDEENAPTNPKRYRFMPLGPEAAATRSTILQASRKRYLNDEALEEKRTMRDQLPMNRYKSQVLEMIDKHQYSIIVGETGSGKTTQVPQILLDEFIDQGNGAACNVVCTQPRRIAAKSVAIRVANERNERLRENVGYQVRFDAQTPHLPGSITYCTTGTLLKQLQMSPDEVLDGVSHLILDEVHERDTTIGFLLVVLKKAIAARLEAGKTAPKVVIMSATIEPSLFREYCKYIDEKGSIQECPSLFVPGRAFPVAEKHLDEIVQNLHSAYPEEELRPYLKSRDTLKYLAAEEDFRRDTSSQSRINQVETRIQWGATSSPGLDFGVTDAANDALVPAELVAATIAHICRAGEEGAILAFLPGLEELTKVSNLLMSMPLKVEFSNPARFKIIMLHSSMKEEQDKLFDTLPENCRKIILSTNIAETSITIPEVRHVVDSGKVAEQRYDATRRITKLQRTWVSRSSSKQRAGRAGRVEHGNYWALFSKARFDSLRQFVLPEMHRTDLQGLVLDIHGHSFNTPTRDFLAASIEPPTAAAVETAIEQLKDTEALTDDEELTPLGRVLASLPVQPSLGKMIILGIIFRCLDPMLILGAAANERSFFVSPLEKRQENKVVREFCSAGTNSDHIALINAFSEARRIKEQEGESAFGDFCSRYFIHHGAFTAIDSASRQIESLLADSGLIPYCPPQDRYRCKVGHPLLNTFSTSPALISGLITAGLHPNVAVSTSTSWMRTATQAQVVPSNSSITATYKDDRNAAKDSEDGKAGRYRKYGSVYTYSKMTVAQVGRLCLLHNVTPSSQLCAILFGKTVECNGYHLDVDGWIPLIPKIEPSTIEEEIPVPLTPHLTHEQRQLILSDQRRPQPVQSRLAWMIYTYRNALNKVLAGAFGALANARAVSRPSSRFGEREEEDEEMQGMAKEGKYLHEDPVRELFARSVKELLEDEMTMHANLKKMPRAAASS